MSDDTATIVIVSAARTPVGSFNGSLASLPGHELGKIAIKDGEHGVAQGKRQSLGNVERNHGTSGAPETKRTSDQARSRGTGGMADMPGCRAVGRPEGKRKERKEAGRATPVVQRSIIT